MDAVTIFESFHQLKQSDKTLLLASLLLSSKYPKFSLNCAKIISLKQQIYPHLHVYDFSGEMPANGYRSALKVIDKFSALLNEQLKRKHWKSIDENLILYSETLVYVLDYACDLLNNEHKLHLYNTKKNENFQLASSKIKIYLNSNFGKYHNFWLTSSSRKINKVYLFIQAFILSKSYFDKLCLIFSHSFRVKCYANFSYSISVQSLRKVFDLSESFFYSSFLPFVRNGFKPNVRKTIEIIRHKSIVINPVTFKVEYPSDLKYSENDKIKFRLVEERLTSVAHECLVFFIHGAGFIATTSKAYENFLRTCALNIKGVPIVSIDYSLAPEFRHPCALQDCLDLYLWLTSGSEEVKEIIGFNPKNIIITGESAGGYLSIMLCFVLNEINKSLRPVILPKCINTLYPLTEINFKLSPSRLFHFYETFVTIGASFAMIDAYLPSTDNEGETCVLSSENAGERIKFVNKLSENNGLNLTDYHDFSSLSNIKLIIICGEYDPLLDDAISILKKWKGPKTFHLIQNVSHGFIHFGLYDNTSREACDLFISEISKAFDESGLVY